MTALACDATPAPLDPERLLTEDPFVRGLARQLLRDTHAADDAAGVQGAAATNALAATAP